MTLTEKNKTEEVEVQILGQNYALRGEADAEYLKSIAIYVDNKLRNSYAKMPGMPTVKAAIMAALTITDELFKLRAENDQLQKLFEEKTAELLHILYSEKSRKK